MSHRPRPAFLVVMLIPVVAAIVIAGVVFTRSLMQDDPAPTATAPATMEPTDVVAVTSPEAGEATPVPESTEAPAGSLTDLMQYAPDRLSDGSLPLPEFAMYSDIERWLASQPDGGGVLTEEDAASLALPSILGSRGLDPIWEATYGFSLADVDQVLAIGQAPNFVFIMRGSFDPAALNAVWASHAYQAVAVEGTTIWSLYPVDNDAIDLSNPASQPAMGSMNNVVLLPDGTLIATAKFSRMKQVLNVVAEKAPSLADVPEVSRLLALENAEQSFVTARIAKGELLESAPTDTRATALPEILMGHDPRGTPVPPVTMPEARMCLFGLLVPRDPVREATPAATPVAPIPDHLTIAIVYDDAASASDAQQVITTRFNEERSPGTGQPYASSMTLTSGETPPTADMVVLHLAPVSGTLDWMRLVEERDFGFLTWTADDRDA